MKHKVKFLTLWLLTSLAVLAALAFLAPAFPASASTVLLSNLDGVAGDTCVTINDAMFEAIVFKIPDATAYDLASVTLNLKGPSDGDVQIELAIYNVDATDLPQTQVYSWSKTEYITTSLGDHTFTPPAVKQFKAGKKYALVIKVLTSSTNIFWCSNVPNKPPSGPATRIGYAYTSDGGATWGIFPFLNLDVRFELAGNSPATAARFQDFQARPSGSGIGWIVFALTGLVMAAALLTRQTQHHRDQGKHQG